MTRSSLRWLRAYLKTPKFPCSLTGRLRRLYRKSMGFYASESTCKYPAILRMKRENFWNNLSSPLLRTSPILRNLKFSHQRSFRRPHAPYECVLEQSAVNLFYMWNNFARVHQTLRVTPAMEAGISSHVWSVREIVALGFPEQMRLAA